MHENAGRALPLARPKEPRHGRTRVLLSGFCFVGSALLVLGASTYSPLDGNKQRLVRTPRAAPAYSAEPRDQPLAKPVAFLSQLNVSAVPTPAGRGLQTLDGWRKRLLRGGFSYDHRGLVVPTEGRYRVYFQLTYQNQIQCSRPLMLIQKVVWIQKSYQDKMDLLQAQDTVPCDLTPFSKTLQASASFDLKAGDALRLQTNHPELLTSKGFLGVDLELQTWTVGIQASQYF